MTDKVNWNPFTNSALTDVQIAELDTDGNGVVSDSEMMKKWDWLSENSRDDDAYFQNTTSTAVSGTANTVEEFKEKCQGLLDEYFENYFNQNFTIMDEDRAKYISSVSNKFNEFINTYLATNPNGPWDMSVVSAEFVKKLDEEMKATSDALNAVNVQVNNYTDMVDTAKANLLVEAFTADENQYVTESEWNKVRNNAVQYLMGMLLSGEIDSDFLLELNSKYSNNSNYKTALSAINELKNCNDPVKMQSLLTQAQENILAFVNSVGKDKCVDAVNNYAKAEGEKAVLGVLDKFIDSYYDSLCTAEMTDAQKAELKTYIENVRDKYMSKIIEDGTIDELTEEALVNGFTNYIAQQGTALVDAQTALFKQTTEIDSSFENLDDVVTKADANGNITEEERTAIIDASKKLIMCQLLSGVSDIAMLTKLGATSEVSKMITLVTQIWAETDPDKLAQLQKELEDLIGQTLEKYSGDQLVNAVKSMKPVEVDEKTRDKALFNTDIYSDYVAEGSRSTSRGKQNEDRLVEIQEMAKADLNKYAEALKQQLKKELGENYNEADVQKYINDAITETISLFTQNVVRRNQHGDYTTGSDNYAFVFARRSGTSKGRYCYNVKALIDAFNANFNKTALQKNAAKLDPSKSTYDRENVLAEALGNKYDRNQTVRKKGHKSDETVYAEVIEEAKKDLEALAASVKASLLAEGVPIDMSKVDEWLDELIMETISDMKTAFQYCQPNGKNRGTKIGVASSYGAATLGATAGAVGSALTVAGTTYLSTSFSLVGTSLVPTTTAATTSATLFGSATAASVVPIVGWCVAGAAAVLGVLGLTTNIFGATYGQHDANAGFFFERKSHSKSGRWGYDPQTLANLFLAKVDAKVAEEKEAYKNKNNPNA